MYALDARHPPHTVEMLGIVFSRPHAEHVFFVQRPTTSGA
jgi:hypothetical protein